MNRLVGTIDNWFADLRTLGVRARKISDILSRKLWIKARNEHGRAHDLGKARRMMLQRIARRRHIWRVQLKRFRASNQGLIGRERVLCCAALIPRITTTGISIALVMTTSRAIKARSKAMKPIPFAEEG